MKPLLTNHSITLKHLVVYVGLSTLCLSSTITANAQSKAKDRQLFWGDTHVHTNYSFDAYVFGNKTIDPDTAYKFARGAPAQHPTTGERIQLARPLDFLTIADHAEMLGVVKRFGEKDAQILKTKFAKKYEKLFAENKGTQIFRSIAASVNNGTDGELLAELQVPEIIAPAWQDIINSADRNNKPGVFTALIGWEWSSAPQTANLHRVIISDANAETAAKFQPYSAVESQRPESLWDFLSLTSDKLNVNFISIPHNSNLSRGLAFAIENSDGQPITPEYARKRMMWERVVEVTQAKGDSETHKMLSPTDEFAGFEVYPFLVTGGQYEDGDVVSSGNYVRPALKQGLSLQNKIGENPFKFGMIGSTDVHTGLATTDENAFAGKLPLWPTPKARMKRREQVGTSAVNTWDMGAQGLAAVWAEQNTRQSLVEAFRNREVYATTGSRIMLRVFAGPSLKKRMMRSRHWAAKARQKGVPMGGDLWGVESTKAPTFLIQAAKDPLSANLDRVQIVKGWVDAEGKQHERIFNVAASDDRRIGTDGSVPALPNTVDLEWATYDTHIGTPEILTSWTDPSFNPEETAFYYVRVLEVATPRHALYDLVALDQTQLDKIEKTVQERAYSSPIWYTPKP